VQCVVRSVMWIGRPLVSSKLLFRLCAGCLISARRWGQRSHLGESDSLAIIGWMKKVAAVQTLVLSAILLTLVLPSCASKPEPYATLEWTSQPFPTLTPNPNFVSPSGSSSGVETSGQACENDARFLEDLTFPDGQVVVPGQIFDKRWSVQNTGSCDWASDYRLVHLGQDEFDAPETVALYPARAGTNAVWQVDLQAPRKVGQYVSQWQAQAPDGSPFGDVVYILISVESPTPTPTATPLVSPTPTP